MPQPVTLSIAMGAQSPNVDDDDGTKNVASSPSKKNNESPSQPPQPQGQEDVLSSSAAPPPSIPSSFSEMKTPISVGIKLETKATTLASDANPIAPVVHRCGVTKAKAKAKAAPIKRTKKKAKPKNNARKIKSTTPKNKVPSSNNDDHDGGGDYDYDARPAEIKQPSLPTPPRDGRQSSSSSNKDNDMGEKRAVGTSAKMSSASPRWHNKKFALPLQKKETVHPPTTNNNNSKSSSSRSKISKDSFLPTTTTTVGEGEKEGGEPPKKRTKKSTSTSKEKVNHNQINSSSSFLSSSTTTSKKQSCSSKSKQGIKGGDDGDDSNNNNNSNISKSKSSSQNNSNSNLRGNKFKARVYSAPSIVDNSHLKKVVNAVIDMVADEIRYCSSFMFGSSSSSERANDNEDILPRHKVTSSSSSSRAGEEALSSSLSSSSSSLRPTIQTKPVGSLKKPSVDDLSLGSSSEGKGIRSVNISAEDTIHPTHNNNGTTTCSSSELGDQGTPSKKNRKIISKRKLPQKQQHPQQQQPPSNNSQTTTTQHNVRTAILAVRHFVSKIYLPHLLSAKKRAGNNKNNNNASPKGSSSPDTDRIRISTLLAIREMLILNAEKLFAFRDPSSSFHFEQGRRHPSKSSSSSSVDWEERRERIRLSHVFANAIVRNAVKRFRMRQPQVVADFARALRNYDDRSEDFRFSLMKADVQSTTFAYNNHHHQGGGGGGGGGGVDREESVLARVSFNYARERHPLMMCSNDTTTPEMLALGDDNDGDVRVGMAKNKNNNWPVHPMPTACAAFHIEPNTVSVTSEDDTDVLESFRTLLRSKRVAL